jgi:hypothetical protein
VPRPAIAAAAPPTSVMNSRRVLIPFFLSARASTVVGTVKPTLSMDFFVHGGTILSANVPVGTFTVKYADGLVWCGEDELFGPDTLIQESERAFDFGVGNEWTIELVRRRGGNLRTRYIKRSEF